TMSTPPVAQSTPPVTQSTPPVTQSTPPVTQSTPNSATSASISPVVTAPTPTTTITPAISPISPGKLPQPPPSLPISPISNGASNNGSPTSRSDSISFGSIFGAEGPPSAEKASTTVSMTAVNEVKSEVEHEEAHEIHCDHLSVHSQTSATVSYLTVDGLIDLKAHYTKKRRPKLITEGQLTHYGDIIIPKKVVLHPQNVHPLRCKVNPKLLKLLNSRHKAIRKMKTRGHRYFKITAFRFARPSRYSSRPMGDRDMGTGYVDAHVAALSEFISSPLSAYSRMVITTKLDDSFTDVIDANVDIIDERAGNREEEDKIEPRIPDSQVKADFYSTLDRPAAKSTESLANVLTGCEAISMIKSRDASTARPICARPTGGLFSRMVKRMTFGYFG
ncbi:hypothetical protein PMAYCL1PPCAC_24526, partial [Pristionchus mayeri]